jgi:hypothetical protein
VKPLWTDDLSGRSTTEILRSDTENRAWNKALRCRVAALVNTRLAKQISLEEYAISRQQENENAAECKRRGAIIVNEMNSRNRLSLRSGEEILVNAGRWLPAHR